MWQWKVTQSDGETSWGASVWGFPWTMFHDLYQAPCFVKLQSRRVLHFPNLFLYLVLILIGKSTMGWRLSDYLVRIKGFHYALSSVDDSRSPQLHCYSPPCLRFTAMGHPAVPGIPFQLLPLCVTCPDMGYVWTKTIKPAGELESTLRLVLTSLVTA